jgi:ferredoxin
MEAVMESGQKHAKWQPAVVAYKEIPSLLTAKDCSACEDCVKACPKGILEVKGKKVVMSKPEDCILCESCVEACKKGALKLEFGSEGFIFTVEPITGLSPKQVVESAVKELLGKISAFEKEIKKAK